MSVVTRFAPSPTGPLHLGHAYAACFAYDLAAAAGGTFLLRIEDLDRSRARPEWEALIETDLAWLGLDWPRPILRQSERGAAYEAALDRLWAMGLLYPCRCRRADIRAAIAAPQEGAPIEGPDGLIYPGTCRPTTPPTGPRPRDITLRLDMGRGCETAKSIAFEEEGEDSDDFGIAPGHQASDRAAMISGIGDVVLARGDGTAAYHLAVVVDDAAQGVTHVTRGADLFAATPIHVLLQRLLGLPTPIYRHHRLIRDEHGKRLAKRDDARALRLYREGGVSPAELRRRLGLPAAPVL